MSNKSKLYQYASKGNWSSQADKYEVLSGIAELEKKLQDEQMKVCELEQREAELAEENKHMNHIMQSHEAVCNDLGKVITERDELAATVERLLVFDMTPDEYHRMTSSERYKQNLNEVKREAYADGYY